MAASSTNQSSSEARRVKGDQDKRQGKHDSNAVAKAPLVCLRRDEERGRDAGSSGVAAQRAPTAAVLLVSTPYLSVRHVPQPQRMAITLPSQHLPTSMTGMNACDTGHARGLLCASALGHSHGRKASYLR